MKDLPNMRYFQSEEAKSFYGATTVADTSIEDEVPNILKLLESSPVYEPASDDKPTVSEHNPPILVPRSMLQISNEYRVIEGEQYTAVISSHPLYASISRLIAEYGANTATQVNYHTEPKTASNHEKVQQEPHATSEVKTREPVDDVELSENLKEMILLKSDLDSKIKDARSKGDSNLVNELRKQRRRVRKKINGLQ